MIALVDIHSDGFEKGARFKRKGYVLERENIHTSSYSPEMGFCA